MDDEVRSVGEPTPATPTEPPPVREPLLNAPMALVALVASFLAIHAGVELFDPTGSHFVEPYALTSTSIAEGRWITALTFNFLHADWLHVGMNSAFGFAFGAAPARLFGRDLRGALTLIAFFLVCGALSGLGFALLPHTGPWALVGASGGLSAFMGASARMLTPGGRLGPPAGRPFWSMALSWVVVNALLGFTPFGQMLSDGGEIAWQAHLIGFALGALLVGVFWRLSGRREPITQ